MAESCQSTTTSYAFSPFAVVVLLYQSDSHSFVERGVGPPVGSVVAQAATAAQQFHMHIAA